MRPTYRIKVGEQESQQQAAVDNGTDWNDYEACHGLAATWPALRAAGLETGEA